MGEWISLHRSLLDSDCFANPTTLKIWVWLLLKANFKNQTAQVDNGKGSMDVKLKRGQLLFGRYKAEQELQIDGSTVYRHMQKLVDYGNIKINSNNKYSIVTICKYDHYQSQNNIT